MRIIALLKLYNISFEALIEIFEVLQIDKQISINTKLNESDLQFIEKIIKNVEFARYFEIKQDFLKSKKNLKKLMIDEIEKIDNFSELSRYEADIIFEYLKSNIFVKLNYLVMHDISIESYISIPISDEVFDLFLQLFKKGKKLQRDEGDAYCDQLDKLRLDIEESYEHKSSKSYSKQDLHNSKKNIHDYETNIMKSLERGDADALGF
jgi:hypothetical protein